MGASAGPPLTNIIIIGCENSTVDNFMCEGSTQFYVCHVDDMLIFVKC